MLRLYSTRIQDPPERPQNLKFNVSEEEGTKGEEQRGITDKLGLQLCYAPQMPLHLTIP